MSYSVRKANCTVPGTALRGSASFRQPKFDDSQHSAEGPQPDGDQGQNGVLCLAIPCPNFAKSIASLQGQNLARACIKWCSDLSEHSCRWSRSLEYPFCLPNTLQPLSG